MELSIITINLNNREGLKKTLDSVRAQANASFEHIIIDGGSSDGSSEMIQEYAASAPYSVKWVSEKDKGIYNAMNKGIRLATGIYIQILNSGDCLASNNVVARMVSGLHDYNMPDILYGNLLRVDAHGTIVGGSGEEDCSFQTFFFSSINHDCAYIKRELFNEYGYYDENLKIVSDWKWYLIAIGLGRVDPKYLNIDVTLFDTTGISETNLSLRAAERRKVIEEIVPPAILKDYDRYPVFELGQIKRLRKYHLYGFFWFIERVLSRFERWGIFKS